MKARQRGFSLIELSIGLMILGLITVGAVMTLNAQAEQRRFVESRSGLNQARDAVLAFITTHGRLPCPAINTSAGQESIASNAGGVITCTLQAGYLPAVTLGLPDLDSGGWFNNAWRDGANPGGVLPRTYRYAVTSLGGAVANALTSPSLGAPGSSTRRLEVQNAFIAGEGWFVCASATGVGAGANRCGTSANLLSGSSALVIWTLGANGVDVATYSADEQQNANLAVPRVVISRGIAPAGATGGVFDDLVTWIPFSLVADRLFAAGFVQ